MCSSWRCLGTLTHLSYKSCWLDLYVHVPLILYFLRLLAVVFQEVHTFKHDVVRWVISLQSFMLVSAPVSEVHGSNQNMNEKKRQIMFTDYTAFTISKTPH